MTARSSTCASGPAAKACYTSAKRSSRCPCCAPTPPPTRPRDGAPPAWSPRPPFPTQTTSTWATRTSARYSSSSTPTSPRLAVPQRAQVRQTPTAAGGHWLRGARQRHPELRRPGAAEGHLSPAPSRAHRRLGVRPAGAAAASLRGSAPAGRAAVPRVGAASRFPSRRCSNGPCRGTSYSRKWSART